MSKPEFSVVIPTRNRPQTLQYAIKTCLSQDFEDYEIIVSDNFSTSDTQNVVEKFNDDRIVFVRTKQPLAMSENWDYAISHVRGDYVLLIGDDDGLVFNSLSLLDKIIDSTKENVIRWEWILYYWPDFFIKNVAGKVYIPINEGVTKLNSAEILKKVVNYKLHYKTLPMLYNSAVHKSVLKDIKTEKNVFFHSQAPDIYSGIVIAKSVEKYLSISTPLNIAGLSKASNGAAQLYTKEKSNVLEDFTNLNEKAGLSWHPKVPSINVLPAVIADSYYHAKDNLFPNEVDILDHENLIKNCFKELSNLSLIQDNDLDKLKSKSAKNPRLIELIKFEHRKNAIVYNKKLKLKQIISKFFGGYTKYSNLFLSDIIEINLKNLGLLNVYDVTEFLDYCGFPKNIEISDNRSKFSVKKLKTISAYRSFDNAVKKFVKNREVSYGKVAN